ncbi:hypothetical protein BD324DRAFT_651444 [Kockovaella imperatae]|uniref:Short-chain dehydrogenase n=1 Tax=Kockovaella imperatae TaxID=4999 RepID=A0A1Y1UFY2_9TREE|nr:hypothetical protein BD324DRAFT_651444 [Kockovaella imperatae]ORX36971.1 hypothetical protein BD324DRAFT_651444 [Kockovaella imperatae]
MVAASILVGVALAIILLTYGLPWLFAEVFPWQSLYKQRHGRPQLLTESYVGRCALVTGANGAYGSRACKLFASRGIKTLVMVDVMDCERLKREIEEELKAEKKPVPDVLVWQVDLMTFAGCEALGAKLETLGHLDHALLTAGILSFKRKESPEGWETSIQVNYLSTALVSLLMLPHLKASSGNPNPPTLTFVTTFGIYPASPTMGVPKTGSYLKRLSNNKDGMAQGHQYGRSKALLLYFGRELAARVSHASADKRLGPITVNSADPGSAWTPLTNVQRTMLIPRLIMDFGARDPHYGAVALTNGASAGPESHGKIMQDFDTASYPPFMNRSSGTAAQRRVWEETQAEFTNKVPSVKRIYDLLDK